MFAPVARRSLPRTVLQQQQRAAVVCMPVRSLSSPPQPSPSAFDPALVKKTPEDKRKDYITYEDSKVRTVVQSSAGLGGLCWGCFVGPRSEGSEFGVAFHCSETKNVTTAHFSLLDAHADTHLCFFF